MKNRVGSKGKQRPEKIRSKTVEVSVSLRFTARRHKNFEQTAGRLGLTSDQLASAIIEVAMAGEEDNPFPEIAHFLVRAVVKLYPEHKRFVALLDAWGSAYDAHDALAEARLS